MVHGDFRASSRGDPGVFFRGRDLTVGGLPCWRQSSTQPRSEEGLRCASLSSSFSSAPLGSMGLSGSAVGFHSDKPYTKLSKIALFFMLPELLSKAILRTPHAFSFKCESQ